MLALLSRAQRLVLASAIALTLVAGLGQVAGASEVLRFILSGIALGALAALVGASIEQVGERLGPGPTGLLQSGLGNLPELFVGIFALRKGLTNVVQAALVGSVLSNTLLVLGLAFLAGGLRHGTQRFPAEGPRMIATLLILAVGALLIPTLAFRLHTPAAAHAGTLSNVCAILLLVVYLASIPFWLRGGPKGPSDDESPSETATQAWPLKLAVTLLAVGSLLSALASDWFVSALEPATKSLGISQTFTGLVIVAIASNAVENAVGIRFALKARPDFAISAILNSPLQIALLLTPVLILVSRVVGPTQLTLVFPPLLVAALAVAAILVVIVIYDGEYNWLEGVALIAVYGIVCASFWWG
jgi:Ca2+:H+ antiporter